MDKGAQETTAYSAHSMRAQGMKIWLLMFKELWQSRDLIRRLALRDISVRYRQSVLGYIWAVVPQIVTVSIFSFLAASRVFPMGELALPYVVYALWNISLWQFFSACLVGSTNSLVNAGSLVTKINFAKEALVFSSIGQALFDFLIRLLPVAMMFIWYQIVPAWQVIFLPLILIPVILMALGLGFILSIVNLVIRDVGNAVSMILTFAMFFAPILYPPPVSDPFFLVNIVNPFSPLLISSQNLITTGHLTQPEMLSAAILFSVFIFFIGWRLFHLTMPRISERA